MKIRCSLLLLCALVNTTLLADEVLFGNGERLVGTVKGLDGGKLTVASESLGELKVDITKVKRFTADKPATVVLKDGSILHLKIAAFEDGELQLAPTTQPVVTGPTPAPGTPSEAPIVRAPGTTGAPTPAAAAAVAAGSLPIADVQKINPPAPKWTGFVTAGAILTRGNSYTDSVATAAEASRRGEDDRMTLGGDYAYGRQKDTDTGEQFTSIDMWNALAKYDYYFTRDWYGYTGVKATHDRIADLELRLMPSAGVGYQWIESSRTNISTEVGGNWVYEEYSNPSRTNEYLAARFAYHVDHKINDTVSLIHNFEFLPDVSDPDTHLINSDAGIRTRLTERFFAEFKISLNYNSMPADDKENTDVRYMASLGYTF